MADQRAGSGALSATCIQLGFASDYSYHQQMSHRITPFCLVFEKNQLLLAFILLSVQLVKNGNLDHVNKLTCYCFVKCHLCII